MDGDDDCNHPIDVLHKWTTGNAMYAVMSTIGLTGAPNARMMKVETVLDDKTAFIFITHACSIKVAEISRDPRIRLHFSFNTRYRQVVVSGVTRIHPPDERQRIWRLLSLERRTRAWANHARRLTPPPPDAASADVQHLEDVPPPYFCSFSCVPSVFEFSEQHGYTRKRKLFTFDDEITPASWKVTKYDYMGAHGMYM